MTHPLTPLERALFVRAIAKHLEDEYGSDPKKAMGISDG